MVWLINPIATGSSVVLLRVIVSMTNLCYIHFTLYSTLVVHTYVHVYTYIFRIYIG